MDDFVLEREMLVRAGSYLAIFATMATWELAAPRRRLTTSKGIRWLGNIGIVVLNTVALRLLFPAAAVGMAWTASEQGFGLLNNVSLPVWLAFVLSVALLDFIIYLQHVLFHAVPALWRLHMVHHADLDFDLTTGTRFHTVEMILSMVIKLGAVAALGPPVVAVLVFEILLNATAVFNHSNARLPIGLDRVLRLVLVTPDMHRVHHSTVPIEANSNFGFNLPWWDRLFGTYRAQPAAGHEGMTIGVRQFRNPQRLTLPWMLALPFFGETGPYPLAHPVRDNPAEEKEGSDQG